MKKILYAFAMLALVTVMTGCEKELMDYEGKDGLYFDSQWGASWGDTTVWAHQIYTLVAFGSSNSDELVGRVKVAVAGSVKDYDRPFNLVVVADSTTAKQGEEFEFLKDRFFIPAGMNHTYVEILFHKTERMSDETFQLQLALQPNEHFDLPFSTLDGVPGRWENDTQMQYSTNTDPNIHNFFVNAILTKPAGWHMVQFGTFTVKKYEMLLRVAYENFGFVKSDFEDNSKMLGGRANAIARVASRFLKEQYAMGRDYWVLDEDGSMMYVHGVPWSEGTRPEDMVDNN